ncbi:hypothetical protein QFC22_002365 [Naganishia vaughanmartiniae]|uniref:Uncharacterized protein n=1 Tax=Naganishia vaughanmartiniae TaxID=1424756 RepID=A0ACC2XE88_9TREE|nr:hypothetical protein QFC22_002365 [Naganishia vaughanmartiniae]
MVKSKTPPPPTLPTAIKTSQEAKLEEGSKYTIGLEQFMSSSRSTAYQIFLPQQWGTEHFYKTYYGHLPQFTCVSGYTGGDTVNPTYRQVCSGTTGHAESVKLTYQKGSIGYGEVSSALTPVKGKIVTEVAPLKAWYNAEDQHQDYLFENPNGYHCPSHYLYW